MGARRGWRTEPESEGKTGMKINDIQKMLAQNGEVGDFRIVSKKINSYELFFVHRKLETVRATDTEDISVTVYVNHDGKLGDSTFSVYGSMGESEVRKHISAAVERAKLVCNEPYELPQGDVLDAELPSNLSEYDPYKLAAAIADAVFAADCTECSSINATEIFLYRDTVHVLNSRGMDKTQVKHHAMIEAIPTYTEGGDSVELYEAYRFTEFDPSAVTAEIAEKMQEVSLRRLAQKPSSPLTANIVLRSGEIGELMSELAGDLNYANVYAQSNLHSKEDRLQGNTASCDPLTLTLCGQVCGSEYSSLFDEDGVSLTDTTVIRDGTVSAYYGSHRFASYLGEPETGNLSCMKLLPGSLTDDELNAEPWIECVSLSGLQVDLYNDYIGGEIRLAYLHDSGTLQPLTGITMSAKLSDALNSLRLSKTTAVRGNYEGPDRMLLRGMTVL